MSKTDKKYYTYPMHEHGYWEILYNLSGEGTATIDGQDFPFAQGTIFYIPPETLHRKTADTGYIDASIFMKDFTPVEGMEIGLYQDDASQTFLKLFLLAYEVQLKDQPNAKAVINALGEAMYQLMVSWSTTSQKRNTQVEAFQNLMLENFANYGFNLHEEMQNTGYCSSYFRKQFKSHTGYTPVNYLNHLRIEYAKRQIQLYHNIRTIKEIALQSGFADPYYFSRVFKKHEGISPQQYIERLGTYDQFLLTGIHYSD